MSNFSSCLIAVITVMVVMDGASAAGRVFAVSRDAVNTVCGREIQSHGGHSGCSYCNALKCYDLDCTKKGCKATVVGKRWWGHR